MMNEPINWCVVFMFLYLIVLHFYYLHYLLWEQFG